MKQNKIATIIAFILFATGGLHAQENSVAGGNEATGTGGVVSYTVGQVAYSASSGTNGSVSQGVQQAYDVSVISGLNESSIQIEMSVYPNPTTNYLNLTVDASIPLSNKQFNYQLIDKQGKLVENKVITAHSTSIQMEELPSATYFLNVSKNNKTVKTFKIIKH